MSEGFPRFQIADITHPEPTKKGPRLEDINRNGEDEGVSLHQNAEGILQASFLTGILGNPGAGKSYLIEQLLNNQQCYGKKFQRVLFVGPTRYKNLIQDSFNTRRVLDTNWIYNKIDECNVWQCRSMLIVFDDVISSLKPSTADTRFMDLFLNRRHLLEHGTISIILSGQKWNLVPTFIRAAYTSLKTSNLIDCQLGLSFLLKKRLGDAHIKFGAQIILVFQFTYSYNIQQRMELSVTPHLADYVTVILHLITVICCVWRLLDDTKREPQTDVGRIKLR